MASIGVDDSSTKWLGGSLAECPACIREVLGSIPGLTSLSLLTASLPKSILTVVLSIRLFTGASRLIPEWFAALPRRRVSLRVTLVVSLYISGLWQRDVRVIKSSAFLRIRIYPSLHEKDSAHISLDSEISSNGKRIVQGKRKLGRYSMETMGPRGSKDKIVKIKRDRANVRCSWECEESR